ncbi:MAG: hypothetical protein GF331_22875 [Chitinivibrionales bacterium]|nr:hypothetical protein [Chitinivibrionales bacterium]
MHADVAAPQLSTNFRKLADTQPDISPYSYTVPNNSACDFTIFQAADGTWQLIACIRGTTYPGSTRFLYRWEAASLSRGMFVPKGIFWTSGTSGEPDALGRTLGVNTPYTAQGRLQAPHCVKENGKYYLFHNNAGAFCLISDDGKNWTQHVAHDGDAKFFDMGRDVMIFDNREADGKWIAYYTDPSTNPQSVAAKTASSLDGPWSSSTVRNVYDGHSHLPSPSYPNEWAESPFVVKQGDDYFLFAQRYVFHSRDPYRFDSPPITCLDDGREWAPEIIQDDAGNWYIAYYQIFGIYLARLEWPGSTASLSIRSNSHGMTAEPGYQVNVKRSPAPRGLAQNLLGRILPSGARAAGARFSVLRGPAVP